MIGYFIVGYFLSGLWAMYYLLKHETPKIDITEIFAGLLIIMMGYIIAINVFCRFIIPKMKLWQIDNPFYKGVKK